jgi:hypothetical protein
VLSGSDQRPAPEVSGAGVNRRDGDVARVNDKQSTVLDFRTTAVRHGFNRGILGHHHAGQKNSGDQPKGAGAEAFHVHLSGCLEFRSRGSGISKKSSRSPMTGSNGKSVTVFRGKYLVEAAWARPAVNERSRFRMPPHRKWQAARAGLLRQLSSVIVAAQMWRSSCERGRATPAVMDWLAGRLLALASHHLRIHREWSGLRDCPNGT